MFFLQQGKKSPPKRSKPNLSSSSDEEPLEVVASRSSRAGRAKPVVKYFDDSDSDGEKENDLTQDWSVSNSGSDFDED